MNPKVFVSHASEDKDRFVLGFAAKLRAKGIDAWVDRWEILPGDSLVDKIFEEGIKNAQAVIVVLSKYSINKPWVREELNAGVVKRINSGSKLIPVVIDVAPDQMPEALKATVWEKIDDLNNYGASLDRIIQSIYGHHDKPPLGTPPPYARNTGIVLPGLTTLDSQTLKLACDQAVEAGLSYIYTEFVQLAAATFGIHSDGVVDALEILAGRGYVETLSHPVGSVMPIYQVTTFGFDIYAKAWIQDYAAIIRDVALAVVNHGYLDSATIASSLKRPLVIVSHVIKLLASYGLVQTHHAAGSNTTYIAYVSPDLKRWLRQTESEYW